MSDLVNAICECRQWSESNLVVARKKSFFSFYDSWGFSTWSGALLVTTVTGGFGTALILGYQYLKYIDKDEPHYRCMTCGADVYDQNVRI
jgi:hypothetical protein